ncbi:MAG TPA: hypothetical protein VIL37_11720 [Natronosporangium sp.]
MRLITAADEELFGLVSAAAKLGKADPLLARLAADHRADPDHPEPAFRYALAMMAALPGVGLDIALDAHARFTVTVEAFGRVLALAPDHWLARYSRARLQALVPGAYGAVTATEVTGQFDAREDLDYLLDRQRGLPPQPYFASTYALAVVVDRLLDHHDPARRAAQFAALAGCPRLPVRLPKLGAVLCEPLVALYHTCTGAERETVGELMSVLYGHQPAVVNARYDQPVR